MPRGQRKSQTMPPMTCRRDFDGGNELPRVRKQEEPG